MSGPFLGILPAAAALILCAGCTRLDFGVSSSSPEWSDSYLLAAESPERARAENLAKVRAAARSRPAAAARDYRIGAADVLEVRIFGLEDPTAATVLTRGVSHEGSAALPWVGDVAVGGLTEAEAERAVRAAYDGRYLVDPQVTLKIAEYRSSAVVVTGLVNKPGVFPLKEGRTTVLESLVLAGGLSREAGNEALLLRGGRAGGAAQGGSETAAAQQGISIDLRELIDKGNLLLNLQMTDGDILTVLPRTPRYIYVLGYVRRPGAYRLEETTRVDGVRAVAMGGGLSDSARAQNCYVIRETAGRQQTIPVDLRQIVRGETPSFYMQPGDTLIVGSSATAKLSEFFRPSMGASVSASASVLP